MRTIHILHALKVVYAELHHRCIIRERNRKFRILSKSQHANTVEETNEFPLFPLQWAFNLYTRFYLSIYSSIHYKKMIFAIPFSPPQYITPHCIVIIICHRIGNEMASTAIAFHFLDFSLWLNTTISVIRNKSLHPTSLPFERNVKVISQQTRRFLWLNYLSVDGYVQLQLLIKSDFGPISMNFI